jgi:sodium-dependent dicarboxylate transporter 2/3/5
MSRALAACAALFAAALAAPAPAGMPPAAWAAAALAILMAALWLTEAIPPAATALAPLAVGPLIGAGGIEALARPYASPLVALMLGGLLLGLAMERCGLHRRIALAILARSGPRPDRAVGGVMAATAFLSMWLSNTATAAMMTPMAVSIAALAAASGRGAGAAALASALGLGVAFAANIGGMATLIGTPPNAVMAAHLAAAHGVEVTFLGWMALGLPAAAVLLAFAWWTLTRVAHPVPGGALEGFGAALAAERARLGPPTPAERLVGAVFAVTAAAWLARPALAALPGLGALTDAGIAMLAALALFALPDRWRGGRPALDWAATRDLPWGVLVLVGGGLSLGSAIADTGLADWIGGRLAGLAAAPFAVVVLAVAAATIAVSHFASNTATAAAFAPVATALAVSVGAAPLALGAPMAIAASCAFMLPVATPPNALVHGAGLVTTAQMARAGALATAAGLAVAVAVGLAAA